MVDLKSNTDSELAIWPDWFCDCNKKNLLYNENNRPSWIQQLLGMYLQWNHFISRVGSRIVLSISIEYSKQYYEKGKKEIAKFILLKYILVRILKYMYMNVHRPPLYNWNHWLLRRFCNPLLRWDPTDIKSILLPTAYDIAYVEPYVQMESHCW